MSADEKISLDFRVDASASSDVVYSNSVCTSKLLTLPRTYKRDNDESTDKSPRLRQKSLELRATSHEPEANEEFDDLGTS